MDRQEPLEAGGILLIDKPEGVTSHDVSSALARRLGVKAGHTGTLDRFATGLLVVCCGRATRLSPYLTGLPKTYRAAALLGKATDTYDATGAVVSTSDRVPTRDEIAAAAGALSGELLQAPPPYSAKKVRGVRSSDWARRGRTVALAPVKITVFELKVENYSYPDLSLFVRCSSGTYVRSLVKDLGDRLGCGACTAALRRMSVGELRVEDAALPGALPAGGGPLLCGRLIPPSEALSFLPALTLGPDAARLFRAGTAIGADAADGACRVFDNDVAFLGVGRVREGSLRAEVVLPLAPPHF